MRKSLYTHWLIACILLLCMGNAVQGQRIVRNDKDDRSPLLPIQTENSLPLKDAIAALERKFRVSILYREQLVLHKSAIPDTVNSGSPDDALRSLLTPFGLTFKKLSPTQILIAERPEYYSTTGKKEKGAGKEQFLLRGTVRNEKNEPLPGVSIIVIGLPKGTVTDAQGNYQLYLHDGTHKIYYSSVGYSSFVTSIRMQRAEAVKNVTLNNAATDLSGVVVAVGSRAAQRTFTNTSLPVDNINGADLLTTGQLTLDKALQFRAPSFNTVNMPVHDATSLSDPYEIRNMGPCRTLILINGKRKNPGSIVYIQTSPGRGETETDLSAIPIDAIKRVEILRDGASALYGSDAIAGVMNIILKDRFEYTSFNTNTGITGKGDGFSIGNSINSGVNFGDKGYANYTISFQKENRTNRPGKVDAEQDNIDLGDGTAEGLEKVKAYLAEFPDARNVNGTPAITAARFLVNVGIPVNDNGSIYANAAYVYKNIQSYANYRTSYWKKDPYNLLHDTASTYLGFGPTFAGDLNDYNATLGFKRDKASWTTDVSATVGGNRQLYSVDNTWNPSMGAHSPTTFRPGGYAFHHYVGNIDCTHKMNEQLAIAFGVEFRKEIFTIIAGDRASYTGMGPISFSGIDNINASTSNRFNFGGYLDLSYDLTKTMLLNASARQEYYNDFGGAFVWKFSGRKKMAGDLLTLRSSVSTGFRAPGLHQVNLQIVQQIFTPGMGVQSKGVVSNRSWQAQVLGVPALKPERSLNFTAGVGLRPSRHFSLTLDYYNINIKDRIILSADIAHTANRNTTLDSVLSANGIIGVSFFTNGISTNTQGLDLVATLKNMRVLNSGRLTVNLAGNYTIANKLLGVVANPKLIDDAGKGIFDYMQEALLLTSRPKYKAILGMDLSVGKCNVNINNTLFGPATFRSEGLDPNLKMVFKPKIVTDAHISWQFKPWLGTSFTVNNIFNTLPGYVFRALNEQGRAVLSDPAALRKNLNAVTFNGRYSIATYDGSHFSQSGTTFLLTFNCKL
ncbi:TonB-dependent receptor [Longitalea arenae]|uniref:TonB-dependent receptor n=1 Tax=Longitalea arenae TaxID=2812558 RepID=UPI001F086140|nr:TonB-dependent receptor [Longitalea arenae]